MSSINRRDFLGLLGAGAVGTGVGFWFGESLKHPRELLLPAVLAPEDMRPGIANYYSSLCPLCTAACGIVVKTREGRAKKIEGNPGHPVSQGGLCAAGQAGLNLLYHPDRLRTPLKRVGARGEGKFEPVGWEEALTGIAARLAELRASYGAQALATVSAPLGGHLDQLFDRFHQAFGQPHYLHYSLDHPTVQRAAYRTAFGFEQLPYYQLGHTRLLLSFGADLLGTGLSPVHDGRGYGDLRRGSPSQRGQLVQIEARMSLTGANADQWLPALPGSEGLLALALARELVANPIYRGTDRAAWQQALDSFTLERAASASGLPLGQLQALAEQVRSTRPLLALAGGAAVHTSNGLATTLAVQALNHLAGSMGHAGGLQANPAPLLPLPDRQASIGQLQSLFTAAASGQLGALLLHDCNPLHALPPALAVREALLNVPLLIALSPLPDDSNAYADWLLPLPSYLEDWQDAAPNPGVGFRAAAIGQPTVAPLYESKAAGDVLLALGRRLELGLAWPDFYSYLRDGWKTLHRQRQSAELPSDFEQFWETVLVAGIWGDGVGGDGIGGEGAPAQARPAWQPAALAQLEAPPARFAGDAGQFPLLLQPYPSASLHGRHGAALPWLQELPDPLTGVVYQSWVELNPATAQAMGLRDGDIVTVTSPVGALDLPLLTYRALHPDAAAIAIGQGHRHHGRYASDKGSNVLALLAAETVDGTGALAWAATRVRIQATGRRQKLLRVGAEDRAHDRNLFGRIEIKEL